MWGALPCLCFLLCLDGRRVEWGKTKAATCRSLEFNDVCGKVCVHVCVCARICVCVFVFVFVQRKGGVPLV